MSDATPPENVRIAAAVVDNWLAQQQEGRLSAEQIAKLTPAQRLDYTRQFDQRKMPEWKDPRG
jgi:hypothetical protein